MESLQYLCAIDQLYLPAYNGPNTIERVLPDNDTMFHWYYPITKLWNALDVQVFFFDRLAFFSGFLMSQY